MASAIRTEGLSKRYDTTLALDALDLTVEAGEVYGYLGPNGAGKTTTIRLLLGLLRPTAGRAELFGVDAWHDPVTAHRRIAYVTANRPPRREHAPISRRSLVGTIAHLAIKNSLGVSALVPDPRAPRTAKFLSSQAAGVGNWMSSPGMDVGSGRGRRCARCRGGGVVAALVPVRGCRRDPVFTHPLPLAEQGAPWLVAELPCSPPNRGDFVDACRCVPGPRTDRGSGVDEACA